MPYISKLLNNKIVDSSDSEVGKLEDILILPKNGHFSPLEFLVIKTKGGVVRYAPYEFVENFTDDEIVLKNLFVKISLEELPKQIFISLKKDVLDKQIVDVSGTRVVRVDDLRIGNFEGKMCVLGIDTSFRGLLRRLGLDNFIFSKIFKVRLIDWREAELLGSGPLQLKALAEHFKRLHPADLANIVEELDLKRGSSILSSLDERDAAKVLEELDTPLQNTFVKYLGPEKSGKILSKMSSDEIVDLAKTFSSEELKGYFSEVGESSAKKIEKLIKYEDNTAGGLMTLEYVSVRPEWNVGQALEEVKKLSSGFRSIFFVYITSDEGKFEGVVSLRRLLTADVDLPLKKLAKTFRSPAVLKPTDKIQKIIKLMTRYNLFTSAVVDKDKKLVGVVTIDDVMRQLFPAA
jgi:CBS domain-containing protein